MGRYILLEQISSSNSDCPSERGGLRTKCQLRIFSPQTYGTLQTDTWIRLLIGLEDSVGLWAFEGTLSHEDIATLPASLLSPLSLPFFNSICLHKKDLICPVGLILITED